MFKVFYIIGRMGRVVYSVVIGCCIRGEKNKRRLERKFGLIV